MRRYVTRFLFSSALAASGGKGAVPRATFAPPLIRLQRGSGGEHAPTLLLSSLSKDFFPVPARWRWIARAMGAKVGALFVTWMKTGREDDMCYLSEGGIPLICFLSLVFHYYCEPVLQYCEPELE